ncbi:molybdopterin-dependent oxidoreductase [Halorutilales archaeon Cl-col2-1]
MSKNQPSHDQPEPGTIEKIAASIGLVDKTWEDDNEGKARKVTEGSDLTNYPPPSEWDDWVEYEAKSQQEREEKHYSIVPTICFNCEAGCGLLAYIDKETDEIRKLEGNPVHPGSRGKNCAKGPATINQVNDPGRIDHPLKRKDGTARGSGEWERVSWDEAVDDIADRMRDALIEDRGDELMYHVGRPGHEGYMDRVLKAWGIDGHNSHTNICSSGARTGYAFWHKYDRPSPDHANADFILLLSAHLESGHYFNPHAQRIVEGMMEGAELAVMDPRLSNTASMADYWFGTWPGTETPVLLSMANIILQEDLYNGEWMKKWVNWEEFLQKEHPDVEVTFDNYIEIIKDIYSEYTPESAAEEAQIDAEKIRKVARKIGKAGENFATHIWRSASVGNLGGWQVSRALHFLNVLTGSVGKEGGTSPNSWNAYEPDFWMDPPDQKFWQELHFPDEWPLAHYEMSFLLPHFLEEDRGKGYVDTYFTRVYNPVYINPDGFKWIEVLRDQEKIGCHIALTPTWNETAYFADYVLPMGHSPERHDIQSQETHNGKWIGFRQPVLREAKERQGEDVEYTYEANHGEVWEEDEFWIELSWRIATGGDVDVEGYDILQQIRDNFESPYRDGEKITIDEYYQWIFENEVPGLPEAADEEDLTPLEYMKKYGAFEIENQIYRKNEDSISPEDIGGEEIDLSAYAEGESAEKKAVAPAADGGEDLEVDFEEGIIRRDDEVTGVVVDDDTGIVVDDPDDIHITDQGAIHTDDTEERESASGVLIDGRAVEGFPTPSGKQEFYQQTAVDWGWPEHKIPGYEQKTHVHPDDIDNDQDEYCLVPTFRLPTLIHSRSANAKWLTEISNRNPVWIHTEDAERMGVQTGDLVKVQTEIGHFVNKAWVTESIKPGIVACSHHMGRWRRDQDTQEGNAWMTSTVDLEDKDGDWEMNLSEGVQAFNSEDPDSSRIFWSEGGVPQNLTHPVHPDPISGTHAWHHQVEVEKAGPNDEYGDVVVDTEKSMEVYQEWVEMARPASEYGQNNLRRPKWLKRPLDPAEETYYFDEDVPQDKSPSPADD